MMDAGCYCAHTLRFFPGCSRPHVTSATAGEAPVAAATPQQQQQQFAGCSRSYVTSATAGEAQLPRDMTAQAG
jgi:hypothetical protein